MVREHRRKRAKQGTLGREYESFLDRLPILLRAVGIERGGGWREYEKAKELLNGMRDIQTPSAHDAATQFVRRYLGV